MMNDIHKWNGLSCVELNDNNMKGENHFVFLVFAFNTAFYDVLLHKYHELQNE